jgi:predicted ATP-grasp superfamily ATP-dependent carboligase
MSSGKKVILLGIDTPIGLTIIRELATHGVTVYGIGREHRSLGAYSRCLHRAFVRPRDEEGTISLLARLSNEERVPFLMAISEPDILMIHRRCQDLGKLMPLVPPPKPFSLATDKGLMLRIAREVGIQIPTLWEIRSENDVGALPIEYPVVLKWPNPNEVSRELSRLGIKFSKAEYCYDQLSLRRAISRYSALGRLPLVQSYAPGTGLGHMIFMRDGKALLRFQHRRIAEWPPEGGFSVVCESLPLDHNPALLDRSIELLRRIGWIGPAMVEYRYDPQTGRAVLMEVNGRFWGSLPLAYYSGAHFAWLTYSALGLGEIPCGEVPRAGVRCRYVAPELKRLLRILFTPGAIQNRALRFSPLREVLAFLLRFADPRARFYVFALRDPLPCFADFWFSVLRMLQRVLVPRAALGASP